MSPSDFPTKPTKKDGSDLGELFFSKSSSNLAENLGLQISNCKYPPNRLIKFQLNDFCFSHVWRDFVISQISLQNEKLKA